MHEDQSAPSPQPAYSQSYTPPPPSAGRSSGIRFGWAALALLLLIGLLVLPTLVERLEYGYARGKMRAEAEVAREHLEQLKQVSDQKGFQAWKDGGLPLTLDAYRFVAMAIQPSVVGVKATRVAGGAPGDELSSIFGRPRFREQDQGSGVIVDPAGYILTNNHVVSRASDVQVVLSDGRSVRARIVGTDPLTDLAVLKISDSDLTAASFGDSDALEVGDPVVAVGNPFGLARSVTSGIISAKGRRAVIENVNYQDFLQTDAAVNPGNSGGPLVNMQGQVVGINTAIYGPTYQGISFAIPSSLAQDVYQKLKTTGKVARGWLGVGSQDLTPELAKHLGVKETAGAIVTQVVPDSPADQAGLQAGDIILEWNDKPVTDAGSLGLGVANTPIGSKAQVVVIRNGQQQTFTVDVGERPERLK